MYDIVYELPKDVELSRYQREKAVNGAYFRVMLGGVNYYIPITKQLKEIFDLHIKNGKFVHKKYDCIKVDEAIRAIIDSVYLQVRDVVCAGIEDSLDDKLRTGFSQLFERYLHEEVSAKVKLALPYKPKDT
jgi:exopolysaccharide biosynthesis protein